MGILNFFEELTFVNSNFSLLISLISWRLKTIIHLIWFLTRFFKVLTLHGDSRPFYNFANFEKEQR